MTETGKTRIPLWQYLLFGTAFVALTVAVLPRSYAEADDPAMVDFLQNGFLVSFMSVTVSRALSFLYSLNHQLPWYALYNWGLLGVSLSLVWRELTESPLSKNAKTGAMILFSIAFLAFTTRMTFTYTSILLGGLAMVLYAKLLYKKLTQAPDDTHLSKFSIMQPVGYGILLALSFLTRWEGLKTLVFFMPFLFACIGYGIYRQCSDKQQTLKTWINTSGLHTFKQLAVTSLCFLSPLLLTAMIEKSLPLTPEETRFDAFMHAHEDNIGFGISNLRNEQGVLKKLGWSMADYEMYQHWLYIDEKTFSTRHMELFSALTKPMIPKIIAATFTPANFCQSIGRTLDNGWFKKRQMAFLFLAALLLVTLNGSTRWQRWAPWGLALTLLAGSWVMEIFLRFPLRVAGPLYYASALSLLCLPGIQLSPQKPSGKRQLFGCILILGLCLVPLLETTYQTVQIIKKQRKFQEDYVFLQKITGPNGFLLRESGIVGIKWFDPLQARVPFIPESSAGWAIFSPPYYERLASKGIAKAADILPWMINRPNAWVLVEPKHIGIIQQYILEHYHRNVQIRAKGHLPSKPKALLYQITSS